jgi:hypothetical protein
MGNYSIDLCPKTNRGAFIHKTVVGLPEVRGYEVPLMPTACELLPEEGWDIPLMPEGGCSYPMQDIRWKQETGRIFTAFGGSVATHNYWNFSITPPQGLFEGKCKRCFSRAATIRLYGDLGFNGGVEVSYGQRVTWRVHRNNLPLPGEFLIAVADCPDGDGDVLMMSGSCATPECGAHGSDCMWGRSVTAFTSGTFLILGSTFFATPTWTGGILVDYFTEGAGWAGVPPGNRVFPSCDVFGDPSLQYKINVEGTLRIVTSAGFAGYGIGTHVLLKKVGPRYSEPFSDSCLGVSEGIPEEFVEYEKIGISDGTFDPSLSALSKTPFNLAESITVFTNYSVYISRTYEVKYLSVTVSPTDGVCSGDCTAGVLNLRTGEWKENIAWTNIPNADGCTTDPDIECRVEVVAQYTKAEEPCVGVVIAPWHIMGMGG